MNADTYLLLSTVLADCPCVDSSLSIATDTTPFALHAIAHQCHYVIHMLSLVRGLLYDDSSAYTAVVQRLAELQTLLHDLKLGRAVLSSAGDSDNAQDVGSAVNPPSSSRPFSSSASALRSGAIAHVGTIPPRVVTYSAHAAVAALPPVTPASTLDMRVTVLGGGSVSRRLLRALIDEHPNLIHPSRISVVTRQPEQLNVFASSGVRCFTRSHGSPAITNCDVLVLAVQPAQVADVVKEQFAERPQGIAELHPPAKLSRSAVVLSCVSGLPRAKLAAMLKHEEQLIVCTGVPAYTQLPSIAARHQEAVVECTQLRAQRMADHDSFLQLAVEEAEGVVMNKTAAVLAELQVREAASKSAHLPEDVVRRAAMRAAGNVVASRYTVPSIAATILEKAPPSNAFLCDVWLALQRYGARELGHGASTGGKGGRGPSPEAGTMRAHAEDFSVAAAEGPLLTTSFAMFPTSVHAAVALTTLQRHGAPGLSPRLRGQQSADDTATSGASVGEETAPSPRDFHGRAPLTSVAEVVATVMRRLPCVYDSQESLLGALQSRYVDITGALHATDAGASEVEE